MTNFVCNSDGFTDSELERFVHSYPYLEFRRYKSVDLHSDRRVLKETVLQDVDKALVTFVTRAENQLTGMAILSPQAWETQFFGKPMLKLRMLVSGTCRKETAAALLEKVLAKASLSDHITLQVDADDFDVRFTAEQFGFHVMDTLCSFEYHSKISTFPDSLKQRFDVRNFQPGDSASVIAVAEKCFDRYPSRFFLDPGLGPEKARQLYVTWAEKCCSKEMAEYLLVAEHRGKIVGFLGWRRHQDLQTYANLRLFGRGLGGCLPTRCNAYVELLWYSIYSHEGTPADFDTHLFNVTTIHAYQQLGLRYVKSKHTMHLWR